MAKIAASGTRIFFAAGAQPLLTAVSVTKANNAVMTVTDTKGLTTGDYISIVGGNWKSLSDIDYTGKVFVAGVIDPVLHTIELRGSYTVAEVETFDPTDAVVRGTNAVEICLATFVRTSPPPSQIDVTTMCDDVRKKVAGLRDSGTFRFDGFYDSADASQIFLRTWFTSGQLRRMSIVPKDNSVIIFDGYCTALGESFGVDQAVTIQGEGVVEGDVFYYRAGAWVDPDPPGPTL
jgi:hypothetical protein